MFFVTLCIQELQEQGATEHARKPCPQVLPESTVLFPDPCSRFACDSEFRQGSSKKGLCTDNVRAHSVGCTTELVFETLFPNLANQAVAGREGPGFFKENNACE